MLNNNFYREEYTFLLSSGTLRQLFPWMEGDWETDKTSFIQLYKEKIL